MLTFGVQNVNSFHKIMSHTDLILIISIITFSSTVGVYVVIKKINQYTTPPQNVLTRRGDIELVDFNEPTQPLQAYFQNFQNADSNTIISYPPSNINLDAIISYRNGPENIPYYQPGLRNINSDQAEIRDWIYCYLENEYIFYS